jgi:hypothetical protein
MNNKKEIVGGANIVATGKTSKERLIEFFAEALDAMSDGFNATDFSDINISFRAHCNDEKMYLVGNDGFKAKEICIDANNPFPGLLSIGVCALAESKMKSTILNKKSIKELIIDTYNEEMKSFLLKQECLREKDASLKEIRGEYAQDEAIKNKISKNIDSLFCECPIYDGAKINIYKINNEKRKRKYSKNNETLESGAFFKAKIDSTIDKNHSMFIVFDCNADVIYDSRYKKDVSPKSNLINRFITKKIRRKFKERYKNSALQPYVSFGFTKIRTKSGMLLHLTEDDAKKNKAIIRVLITNRADPIARTVLFFDLYGNRIKSREEINKEKS